MGEASAAGSEGTDTNIKALNERADGILARFEQLQHHETEKTGETEELLERNARKTDLTQTPGSSDEEIPEDKISERAKKAVKRAIKANTNGSKPLMAKRIWHKLLELFDWVFGNRETEVVYRLRDAIKRQDIDEVGRLLKNEEDIKDELYNYICGDDEKLLKAMQGCTDKSIKGLVLVLELPSPEETLDDSQQNPEVPATGSAKQPAPAQPPKPSTQAPAAAAPRASGAAGTLRSGGVLLTLNDATLADFNRRDQDMSGLGNGCGFYAILSQMEPDDFEKDILTVPEGGFQGRPFGGAVLATLNGAQTKEAQAAVRALRQVLEYNTGDRLDTDCLHRVAQLRGRAVVAIDTRGSLNVRQIDFAIPNADVVLVARPENFAADFSVWLSSFLVEKGINKGPAIDTIKQYVAQIARPNMNVDVDNITVLEVIEGLLRNPQTIGLLHPTENHFHALQPAAQPFDSAAVARELAREGNRQGFINRIRALNADQLEAISNYSSGFLEDNAASFDEIGRIMQGKDASFRKAVLLQLTPIIANAVLQRNCYAHVEDILADIDWDTVAIILNGIPTTNRVEIIRQLPAEKLAGLTAAQRDALLRGLRRTWKSQMEELLNAAAPKQPAQKPQAPVPPKSSTTPPKPAPNPAPAKPPAPPTRTSAPAPKLAKPAPNPTPAKPPAPSTRTSAPAPKLAKPAPAAAKPAPASDPSALGSFDVDQEISALVELNKSTNKTPLRERLRSLTDGQLEAVSQKIKPGFWGYFNNNGIRKIIENKSENYRATILMHMRQGRISNLLRYNPEVLAGMNRDQLVSVLTQVLAVLRLEVMQRLPQDIRARLTGLTSQQRTALLRGLSGDERSQMEKLLSFNAAAKVREFCQLKTERPNLHKVRKELVEGFHPLDAEQLKAVLQADPKLLDGLTSDEILQIIQGKNPDFRAAVLLKITTENARLVLERDSYAHVEDILGDIGWDTVIIILGRIPTNRVEILQQLSQERLTELTAAQRAALLRGLKDDQRTQIEALLDTAAALSKLKEGLFNASEATLIRNAAQGLPQHSQAKFIEAINLTKEITKSLPQQYAEALENLVIAVQKQNAKSSSFWPMSRKPRRSVQECLQAFNGVEIPENTRSLITKLGDLLRSAEGKQMLKDVEKRPDSWDEFAKYAVGVPGICSDIFYANPQTRPVGLVGKIFQYGVGQPENNKQKAIATVISLCSHLRGDISLYSNSSENRECMFPLEISKTMPRTISDVIKDADPTHHTLWNMVWPR
jgi:Mg/Co/Ni transporter MgtE